jgi:hypothetical protein
MAANQGRHLTPSLFGFRFKFFRPQFLRLHHRQDMAVVMLDVGNRRVSKYSRAFGQGLMLTRR